MGWYEDALRTGADTGQLNAAKAIIDRAFGGTIADPGNLESFLRGGASAAEFRLDTERRAVPTASAGGIGGDADLNQDRRIDAGWIANPDGGSNAWLWGGVGRAPSASNTGAMRGTWDPGGAYDVLRFFGRLPNDAPSSRPTSQPGTPGGQPQTFRSQGQFTVPTPKDEMPWTRVKAYYRWFLGRDPSEAEVEGFLTAHHESTQPLDEFLVDAFSQSPEYQKRFGTEVRALYRDILGRDASDEEVQLWRDNLNPQGIAGIRQDIANSPEYGSRLAALFDAKGQLKPGWKHTATGYQFTPSAGTPGPWSGGTDPRAPWSPDGSLSEPRIDFPFNPRPDGSWWTGPPGGGTSTTRGGGVGEWGPGSMADTVIGQAPQSLQPFTEQFSYPDFVAPTPRAPNYPGFVAPSARAQTYPSFVAPTVEDARADPGWQFRLSEAQKAIERSAAARGSYLTPNTMRALMDTSQNLASDEYGNVYGRRFGEWDTGYRRLVGEDADAYNRGFGEWETGYRRLFGEDADAMGRAVSTYGANRTNQRDLFETRRNIFDTNEANRFGSQRTNRIDNLAELMGARRYDLGLRAANLGDRQFTFGSDLANRQFTFGSDLANRQFDFTRDTDAFNRQRTGYLDDFNIYNTLSQNYYDNLYRLGVLGRPF